MKEKGIEKKDVYVYKMNVKTDGMDAARRRARESKKIADLLFPESFPE